MSKKALVTGITGQDGSYLAEFLLEKGYEVHGLIRKSSTFNTYRIEHLYTDPHEPASRLFLHYADLADSAQLTNIVHEVAPDEIYHLGAQSHVKVSFEIPEYTGAVTGLGTTRVLEAVRVSGNRPKFYQACSAEIFGSAKSPQNEDTPFQPRSPYAAAKLYAYWVARNYREAYDIPVFNGILFNHESPRRGETFVTRKITRGVARILAGKERYLYLGNLDAKRDWGYAPEYVRVMWRMLQQDRATDYVLGTGEAHSVLEFVEEAFSYVGKDWRRHLKTDARYFRPTEPGILLADASKAVMELAWKPMVAFKHLVRIMVDADMEAVGLTPPGEGTEFLRKVGFLAQDRRVSTGVRDELANR
jgi:GDPmannose 4,6-dehydratase